MTGNQAIVVWAIKRPEEKPVLNPQSGFFDFDDFLSPIADESKALHDDISISHSASVNGRLFISSSCGQKII